MRTGFGWCARRTLREFMHKRAIVGLIVGALTIGPAPRVSFTAEAACPSTLNHKVSNLMDEAVSLCQFQGKVVLVVNTASECGYTPQYDGLEKIYRRYRDKGFVVLGFPSNEFGGQEPGTNKQIAQFCQVNYSITFPVFAKSSVLGAKANSFYRELAGKTGKAPQWNFHKYLLDRKGQVIGVFASAVEPDDERLIGQIEKALAKLE